MDPSTHRRSRPVADLPIADLRDGMDVAKRWLLELIGSAPLSAAKAVRPEELARGGPPLCAAMIEAIGSDPALDSLGSSASAADAGHLAGAVDAATTAAAVEALRIALLSAVRSRLSEPSGELVAAVTDRISEVAATVLARSLGAGAVEDETPPVARDEMPVAEAEPARAPAEAPAEAPAIREIVPEPDIPISVSKPAGGAHESPGEDPWLAAIQRRIERAGEGESFAVLTVEIDDIDRIVASGSGKEVAGAIDAAERAMISALAPADVLVRERVGRYWVISPAQDRAEARELGETLAACVSDSAQMAGAPLTASAGLAMYPADGDKPGQLAAGADEGLYTARSAGIRIA